MPPRRRTTSAEPARKQPPAKTPEQREQQLISLATDLAERQLSEGTASAQVVTHYLKLGSSREKLEQERLEKENELLEAKKEAMASVQRAEELMTEAIRAFRSYSGADPDEEYDDENV